MASEQMALANIPSWANVYCYIPGTTLIAEKDEYGYGVSSPCISQPPSEPNCGQPTPTRTTSYGSYVFGTPCQVIIYDAGGNRAAETDAYFDGSSTVCGTGGSPTTSVSGLVANTHDETNYGPNATTTRGNITKLVKWANVGPSSTTTYSFDETGQVTSSTDACGTLTCVDMAGNSHTTSYFYTDQYVGGTPTGVTNAYLTLQEAPSTNGVIHKRSYTYRFQDGQLNTSTDENGQTTTYSYNDSLNRLTNTQGPADPNNGNQHPSVTYTYNDSANTITTSELLNTSGLLKTSVSVMDGLGHVTQTQLTSDPGVVDYVDTSYNGMGQIKSVSNPYRGSAPANNTRWYLYDALGRTIEQVQPDGNLIQWGYNGVCSTPAVANCNANQSGTVLSGSWADVTDEAGHHSQRVSDSFGRLIKVEEPDPKSGVLALETDYVYDALNNLTSVKQRGTSSDIPRSRSFTYDSLSRLLTAANPESGTTCYGQWSGGNCTNGYDGNGNLAYKTDARGVVTSYSYDVLNRMLSKTYTNDSAGSPWPCYQYDGSSVPNSIGRLTTQWTQSASAGACSLSNTAWTKRAILQYDSMGRVLS
jgi:YD repeat-containing protein